jgi:hypothetical protein
MDATIAYDIAHVVTYVGLRWPTRSLAETFFTSVAGFGIYALLSEVPAIVPSTSTGT